MLTYRYQHVNKGKCYVVFFVLQFQTFLQLHLLVSLPPLRPMRVFSWRGHQAGSSEVHSDRLSELLSCVSHFLLIHLIIHPLLCGWLFHCAPRGGSGRAWVPAGVEDT